MSRLALALLLAPALAFAAPEDRGTRGFFIGAGGGVSVGTTVTEDGRDPGGFVGSGGWLRFGEEAVPGLTLGLAFAGTGASNGEAYDVGGGGFFLEASWRPPLPVDGLVIMGGSGLGGAALTARDDAEASGSTGGAVFEFGLTWEFDLSGRDDAGFAIGPTAFWYFVPKAGDGTVYVSAFVIGVGTTWYKGR